MLSLHALMLCTRLLIASAHDVARCVRTLLPPPAKRAAGGDADDADDDEDELLERHPATPPSADAAAEEAEEAGDGARCACGARAAANSEHGAADDARA